ncbi:MAG: ParM/StbA family protein [Candidatus Nitrospinota bacterium M3_3B_026]
MLGLDIGFGDVKAVAEDGRKLKIPTAVAYAGDGVCDLGELSNDHREHLYMGRKYVVGEAAISRAFSTRSLEFLRKYAPLLACRAIEELKMNISSLAFGLPMAYYTSQNKSEFLSSMRKIEVDGRTMELGAEVFPQGVGALLDYRLSDDGSEKEGTAVCGLVLDVGFNTVDVVAFENGSAVKADSGMLERAGISKVTQELANALQTETTINLSEQEAKDALLKGKLAVYGYEKDLSETIRGTTERYVEWLLSVVASRWEDRLQRAGKLILAGGGAYYLKTYIPARYRKVLFIPDEPEFANARGFLKALKARALKTA